MVEIHRIKGGEIKVPEIEKTISHNPAIVSEPYFALSMIATVKSGKSTVIYNIVEKMLKKNKKLKVHIYSGNVYRDPTYRALTDFLTTGGYDYEVYTSIYYKKSDGRGKDKAGSHMGDLLQIDLGSSGGFDLKTPVREYDEITSSYLRIMKLKDKALEKDNPITKIVTGEDKSSPDMLLIFDDISNEMKDKDLREVIRFRRHLHANIILSSQAKIDILPSIFSLCDYFCLFANIPIDKLKNLHENIALPNEFDVFERLYKFATHKKFNFLFIDRVEWQLRRNLNEIFHTL